MRLAFLADIHGNLPAFEAALDHAYRQQPDQIIIVGDIVVGSPDSRACLELAQSLSCPIIRGNHERYVASFGQPDAPAAWQSNQFAPVRWAYDQLTPEQRATINGLPQFLRLPDCPDLMIVHASLRNDRDTVYAYTPDDEIAAMFPTAETTIVRAHNHVPQVRLWEEQRIITTGSVGLALNLEPTAQYLLLDRVAGEWRIRHQSVPYDQEQALARFDQSGYLEEVGPMARLFMREVATAAGQIVPFLRDYERWNATEPITLEAAIQRFLQR